jgi:hypothetical protein
MNNNFLVYLRDLSSSPLGPVLFFTGNGELRASGSYTDGEPGGNLASNSREQI